MKVSGAGMGNGLAGLVYYATNDSDPYITLKNTVRPTIVYDNVCVCCYIGSRR